DEVPVRLDEPSHGVVDHEVRIIDETLHCDHLPGPSPSDVLVLAIIQPSSIYRLRAFIFSPPLAARSAVVAAISRRRPKRPPRDVIVSPSAAAEALDPAATAPSSNSVTPVNPRG